MIVSKETGLSYLERCADAFMVHLDKGTFEGHFGMWTVFGGEPPQDPLGFYIDFTTAITESCRAYGTSSSCLVRQITPDYQMFGKWGAPRIVRKKFA